jgi:hypothetical protein
VMVGKSFGETPDQSVMLASAELNVPIGTSVARRIVQPRLVVLAVRQWGKTAGDERDPKARAVAGELVRD